MIVTYDPDNGDPNGMYTVNGNLSDFPGNNWWASDTLAQLGATSCLPRGNHEVTYIATDDCGNTSSCLFTLTVADKTPPVVACTALTQVAISADGAILVNAGTFDQGSFDNCSPVRFKARRMDANSCQPDSLFYDQVKFCCSDINDTITVILRVYDIA